MIQPTIKSMNNVRIKFAEVISAMALYDKEKTFLLEMNLLTNVLIALEDEMLETVMTDDEYTILRLFHARLCAY